MADIVALARDFYDRACGDPAFAAALRTNFNAMLDGSMTGALDGSIVQGSKNGGNYTIRIDLSTTDRRAALGMAVRGLDNGTRPSRTYHARFAPVQL